MEVFARGDVAFILGMPEAKVKNWTIGRPLKLGPSVRTARGTGSRNLYNIEDIYAMGLANSLAKAGLDLEVVGHVIQQVKDGLIPRNERRGATAKTPRFGRISEMFLELKSKEMVITLTGNTFMPPGLVLKSTYRGTPFVRVRYTVNVFSIISDIDRSVDSLTGRDEE